MTQSPGRAAADSGSTSIKQGRVKLCNCQMLACHVVTSSPSPSAMCVRTVSQLLSAPGCDFDRRSSAWVLTRHRVCAKFTSTSSGGDGGDQTGVAGIGDTGEAGSETGCGSG